MAEPSDHLSAIEAYLTGLQDRICQSIESLDGRERFREDAWTRAERGDGRLRILANGGVFEQAGIGFSRVSGSTPTTFPRPSIAPNWPAAAGPPWAFRWSFIP